MYALLKRLSIFQLKGNEHLHNLTQEKSITYKDSERAKNRAQKDLGFFFFRNYYKYQCLTPNLNNYPTFKNQTKYSSY